MIRTQQQLDLALDRTHTINVSVDPRGPLPNGNPSYNALRPLAQTGFSLTARELLHAIGCKTAALPVGNNDECLKAAWLYTQVLDLDGPHLSFRGNYGSDLQIPRSMEIGIGMMCLIAERYLGIPWDQLGPLPGRGKRFDYRGTAGTLDCIFESKGTSNQASQTTQIKSGLGKKIAHHQRGEHFDVELVVSTFIGRDGSPPAILLADPDKSSFRELFERGDYRYFRLKHYCRVLQFIGLPRSALHLNRYAQEYLENRRSVYQTIFDEKQERGYLESVMVQGDEFLGRWFDSWLPLHSKRYENLISKESTRLYRRIRPCRKIFQGVRRDFYESGLGPEPFSQPLLERQEAGNYREAQHSRVSVMPDGTIMIFQQD